MNPTPTEMLESGTNLHDRPLTDRQATALKRRKLRLEKNHSGSQACVGCYSGIVPWNQGSALCTRCIYNCTP